MDRRVPCGRRALADAARQLVIDTDMTSADESRAYAEAGPAFEQLRRLGPVDWNEWNAAAARLERALSGAADLPRRIHHLYLPVLFFCVARARTVTRRPYLIGVQAPQGAGKTTLVSHLLAQLPELGLRATGVSIDDFYLTREEQLRLAAAHPGNPYLEHRGYPGTHDVELGVATLTALRNLGSSGGADSHRAHIPVYDKSLHGGRGDRTPESAWREVAAPIDIVFVEGWMLGFSPLPDDRIDDPFLIEPNRALAAYDRWHRLLDAFVVLRAVDPRFVLRWRVEAEEAMRASGRPGLDRAAIEDYIRRFLPAYAHYGGAPENIPSDRTLSVWLDERRRPSAP
jgi:D-glycerate 3-kinase